MTDQVFRTALKASKDITESFCANFGWDEFECSTIQRTDAAVRRHVRTLMEKKGGVSRRLDLAGPYLEEAQRLLGEGLVGAVDGTDAMSKIDLMNTSKYACAVSWVTSRERGVPNVLITSATTDYLNPEEIERYGWNQLGELEKRLNETRNSQSWPTTFREYKEREVALDACPAKCVLLDGPIVTQNLLTQSVGQDLLSRIIGSNDRVFIGVIKNVANAMARTKWTAYSLEPGEVWVVGPIKDELLEDRDLSMPWTKNLSDSMVRVVYRPRQKAFAFECDAKHVGLASAILLADASPTINHELPALLEAVDAKLRSGFNSTLASEITLNRMMQDTRAPIANYRAAIDAISERDFR